MELHDPFWSELAGRYRPERHLGAGGMAEVWLVHDERHGRLVALKLLGEHLASAMGQDRFKREIALLARLQHPNVLPLIDSGENAGRMWYVTPFIEGESLRDRLEREGKLDITEALRLGTELLDALGYAHRSGVVHRDIKPENVLLSQGHALLADFGIAREEGQDRLTATGLSVGTPSYMSPEQVAGEGAGAPSDLYAMGCVLFECLTGQPPFTGPDARAVMAQHVMDPAPSLRARRPNVPEGVERVVLRAVEKDPKDRWTDAAAFARALSEPATSKTDLVASGVRRAAPRRRRRMIAVAGAAVVVAVSAVGTLLWQNSRRLVVGPDVPLRQVTFRGDLCSTTMSPDGRYVTYVAGLRVWLTDLDRNRSWPVTDTSNGHGCGPGFEALWNADGRTFVFRRGDSAYVANTSGDAAHAIGGAAMLDSIAGYSGVLLALADSDSAGRAVLSVRSLGLPERTPTFRGPAISPDGLRAYVHAWTRDTQRVAIVDVGSGRVVLTDIYSRTFWRERWSADGSALYVRPDSGAGLLRVDVDPRRLRPTGSKALLLPRLDTAAELKGVAVSRNRAAFDVYRAASRVVVARVSPPGGRTRYSAADVTTGSIMPAGGATVTRRDSLIFVARTDSGKALFEMSLPGGVPQRLAAAGGRFLRLSPDEATVLTVDRIERGWRANLVDLRTGATRVLPGWNPRQLHLDCVPIDWDPTGRSVLAVSGETGWEVLRINALSGGADTLRADSTGVVACPSVSPDGKWLATHFEDGAERAILLLPLAGGEGRRIPFPYRETYPLGWLDSLHVVVLERPASSDSDLVWVYDLVGTRALLGKLPQFCLGATLSPRRSEIVCGARRVTMDVWIADDFDPYFRPPQPAPRRP